MGCGSSPLFNHTSAPDPDQQQQQPKPEANQKKFSKIDTYFTITWPKMASASDESSFQILIEPNSEGVAKPIFDEYELEVELWMPDHGHGAPPVEIVKISAFEVIVRDIWFIMPGHWEVRLRLKQGQQVVDQYVLEVNL